MTKPYRRISRANPINYWWDFTENATKLVLRSNDPRYPIIMIFGVYGRDFCGTAVEIVYAQRLIKMLETGQVTAKRIIEAGQDKVTLTRWPHGKYND